jgi:pimeloyl-ACP methyl ester carboxylesterase
VTVTPATLARVAGALTIAGAAALVFTATDAGLPAARLQPVSVRAGSLALRVVRSGRGEAIVLVHGFGESLVTWRSVFTRLADSADVVALDLPGHGLSSKPASGYATDSLAADLIEALDALGIERAVLVGHSLGGAIAAATALRAPERVAGLVLIDPAISVARSMLPDSLAQPTGPGDAVRHAIAEYEAQRSRFTSVHDPGWLRESDTALAYLPALDPAYRPALAATLREFDFRYLTPERAARLRMPVLLIWGQFDPLLPVENGRRLAALLPRARLVVVPRCWHRPQVERPDTVARLIARFLGHRDADTP